MEVRRLLSLPVLDLLRNQGGHDEPLVQQLIHDHAKGEHVGLLHARGDIRSE